jgi:branched-subunit amino acid aminotransferase/4-amino-4-deoxychorismate lyase
MRIYTIDGKIVSETEPWFTPNSRGYRYGDGFFESMKMSHGRVLHYDLHLARIRKSAMLLKIQLPDGFQDDILQKWINDTAESQNIKNARLRCTFFREASGFYAPETAQPSIVIEFQPIDSSGYEWNEIGLVLGAYKEMAKNGNFTSTLKTTSSLLYVMAGIYATENKLDECVIFNDQGRIAECISCNLFTVTGEFITTPPLSEYCVDGVMRKVVMHLAGAYGYTVIEQPLNEVTLNSADEIFLTNAGRGIRWVGDFRGKAFKCNVSKVLAEKLQPKGY